MLNKILSLTALLIFATFSYAQDQITITTYYPSPYGSYSELRTDEMSVGVSYRGLGIPTSGLIVEGRVGIGTATPTQKLSVAGFVQSTMGGFMFPNGTMQSVAMPGGVWCGLRMSDHAGPVFPCGGLDPMVSCPTGFSSVFFALMTGHGGNWYTCVK